MQRTLTPALLTEIGATITEPLFLIEIQAVSATYRINTWDQVISFNSLVWVPAGCAVSGLSWDGKARRSGRLTLVDPDLTWWLLALANELSARPITIYQAYAGAPNDSLGMFSGRTGGPGREESNTVLDLLNEKGGKQRTPRQRIGIATGATQLVPAGTIFWLGGVKYTLERPKA